MNNSSFKLDDIHNLTVNPENWARLLYQHCPQLTVCTQYNHTSGLGMCVQLINNNPPFYTPVDSIDLGQAENILVNTSTENKKQFLILEKKGDNIYNVNPNYSSKRLISLLSYIFRDEVYYYLTSLLKEVRLEDVVKVKPLYLNLSKDLFVCHYTLTFDSFFKPYINDLVLSRINYREKVFTSAKMSIPVRFSNFVYDDKVLVTADIKYSDVLPVNKPLAIHKNVLVRYNEIQLNSVKVVHILAKGLNNEIGHCNGLIWHIKEDLKHFKSMTINHVVIMGRKTFESIGDVLPNRFNIVITASKEYKVDHEDVLVVNSIEEAIYQGKIKSLELNVEELFIIGGSKIYEQTLSISDKIYVTQIMDSFPLADAFYNFNLNEFVLTSSSKIKESVDGIKFRYDIYIRK